MTWLSHTTVSRRVGAVTVWPSTGPGVRPRAESDREMCPECLGEGEWIDRWGALVDVCPTCGGRGWL